jgi:hypothetical protein
MNYEFDLDGLRVDFNEAIDQADAVRTSGRALLAIAERIEALVDVQTRLCEIQQKVLWQIEGDK